MRRHNKKYFLATGRGLPGSIRCSARTTATRPTAVRRRIPPLNPLRVFETVARTGNLTASAHELHVTQSAVSRQIAVLESYLGVELLRRERHGVSLTRVGRAFADQVVPAFAAIADATEDLFKDTSPGALRLRTYTTFAAHWLIPRLPISMPAIPASRCASAPAVPDVDFDRDQVDMAVQFGDGAGPTSTPTCCFPT